MSSSEHNNTYEFFIELSGEANMEDMDKYCLPAIRLVKSKLKNKDTNINDIPELYTLAASIAYYRYVLMEYNSYSSFSAGSLSVNVSVADLKETALELIKLALPEAAVYLNTNAVFKSIGGNL